MTNISLSTSVTGSGPAVVLAHGAGGGIEANFGSLIPLLARRHTVIGSDYPADDTVLNLDDLADALVEAAVAAGARRFPIIGFSLGTAVAVRAAIRHRDRVSGLVLAAGLARADHRARLILDLWRTALAAGDHDAFARIVLLSGYSAAFINSRTDTECSRLLTQIAAAVPGGTAAQADLVSVVDTRADLPAITVPTRIIAATADLLVDPANSRELAAAIPGARYVEIDAGHVLMHESPDAWHRAVLGYFAEHPALAA
ncbi:alpha/beta fold hydrolase [Nocardia spumae]|uniref:alpha/beta fold hydrolase n=1 Tax=Nocardia spumae TaxID=2887190 RepID=UPI001D13E1AC|nr:alpha/beta fold hydrolase [Nocardia spumae]